MFSDMFKYPDYGPSNLQIIILMNNDTEL